MAEPFGGSELNTAAICIRVWVCYGREIVAIYKFKIIIRARSHFQVIQPFEKFLSSYIPSKHYSFSSKSIISKPYFPQGMILVVYFANNSEKLSVVMKYLHRHCLFNNNVEQ